MLRRDFAAAIGTGLAAVMTATRAPAQPGPKGRVLVVLSGAQMLELRDGKTYPTGFFLNEVSTPVAALIQAGYAPVFTTPGGKPARWDPRSAAPVFFGGSADRLEEAKRFVEGLEGIQSPRPLAAVREESTEGYAAVLIPGGHAAMQDLPTDPDLGAVLRAFHAAGKPTGAICHGPAGLLAALPDSGAFVAAMAKGDVAAAQALSKDWIYNGYHMTAFTTSEERLAEARLLGGPMRYYLTEALSQAGGRVVTGPDRRSLTAQDRELITGQQPFSDEEFTSLFLRKIDGRQASR